MEAPRLGTEDRRPGMVVRLSTVGRHRGMEARHRDTEARHRDTEAHRRDTKARHRDMEDHRRVTAAAKVIRPLMKAAVTKGDMAAVTRNIRTDTVYASQ
jgi:hypothetical protein